MTRRCVVLLLLAACGAPPTPEPVPPTPVASTPLTGKIDGVAWTPRSAVASARRAFSDDGGERWIDLGVGTFDCSNFIPEAELIGTVPWTVGAYDFSLRQNVTFVVEEDGKTVNKVATNGRIELLSAPGPDAGVATLRIRARFDADNEIEGEVSLTVCD